jgi:hypothetical protein
VQPKIILRSSFCTFTSLSICVGLTVIRARAYSIGARTTSCLEGAATFAQRWQLTFPSLPLYHFDLLLSDDPRAPHSLLSHLTPKCVIKLVLMRPSPPCLITGVSLLEIWLFMKNQVSDAFFGLHVHYSPLGLHSRLGDFFRIYLYVSLSGETTHFRASQVCRLRHNLLIQVKEDDKDLLTSTWYSLAMNDCIPVFHLCSRG